MKFTIMDAIKLLTMIPGVAFGLVAAPEPNALTNNVVVWEKAVEIGVFDKTSRVDRLSIRAVDSATSNSILQMGLVDSGTGYSISEFQLHANRTGYELSCWIYDGNHRIMIADGKSELASTSALTISPDGETVVLSSRYLGREAQLVDKWRLMETKGKATVAPSRTPLTWKAISNNEENTKTEKGMSSMSMAEWLDYLEKLADEEIQKASAPDNP